MNFTSISLLIAFTCLILSYSGNNGSEIVENFDGDSYGNWIAEGNTFVNGPVSSDEIIGALGSGYASSVNEDNESATGTLTSPEFIINKKSIHFLLGANEIDFLNDYSDNINLAVELLIDGKVVRSTVPGKFYAMFWEGWDVAEFEGKAVRFRIVDNDNRKWAHISVDQILQTDLPADGLIIYHGEIIEEHSIFPWWNHWPASQITSDGRSAHAADRLAHSSLI